MNPNENLHLRRPHGIGGSDVAALLGLSPYKSPVQLWAEKVGHPGFEHAQGIHLRLGQHLEPFVAAEYERSTGLVAKVHPDPIFHAEHPFFFAHVDRLVQTDPACTNRVGGVTLADTVLGCKTSGAFNKGEWGEAHTDQVPTPYMLQCAWYMALTHCDRANVAVLIGNNDFRVYHLHRNSELESAIFDHAKRFWSECVVAGVPPAPKSALDASILYPFSRPGGSGGCWHRRCRRRWPHAQLPARDEEPRGGNGETEVLRNVSNGRGRGAGLGRAGPRHLEVHQACKATGRAGASACPPRSGRDVHSERRRC